MKDSEENLIPCRDKSTGKEFLKELEFTDEEIQLWSKGEDVLRFDKEYIISHYKFYELLYKEGICFHPDTLIKYAK